MANFLSSSARVWPTVDTDPFELFDIAFLGLVIKSVQYTNWLTTCAIASCLGTFFESCLALGEVAVLRGCVEICRDPTRTAEGHRIVDSRHPGTPMKRRARDIWSDRMHTRAGIPAYDFRMRFDGPLH
jgi:hypothetical protein